MLKLRIPLGAGESATSYCSRLAARNRCGSVREFCLDVGLSFRAIVDGAHDAIADLARLGGVDLDQLWQSTLRRSRETAICGRNLIGVGLRRAPVRLFVCPVCLAGDASEHPDLGHAAFFGRTAWLIEPIRTCTRHARALIDLNPAERAPDSHSLKTHDFSARIKPHTGRIIDLAASAPTVVPSDLERYLVDCIEGTPPVPGFWPDSLPFHLVAVASELVGSLHLFGPKHKTKDLTEDQRRDAGAAGFPYLAAGPEGFRQGLVDNLSRWPQSQGAFAKAGSYFGPLYPWLREQRENPASDQLRDILREVMLSHRPVGPGETLFGEPIIDDRRVYSVHAAAGMVGLHAKTMARMLRAAGILDQAGPRVSSHRAVFPVTSDTTAFLERLKRRLSCCDAAEYLGLNRSQFLSLHRAGLVVPFLTQPSTERSSRHYFDPVEIDAFLDGQLQGRTVPEDVAGLMPLSNASRRACCSLVEAIRIVQSGQLQRVFRSPQGRGLDTVLVDPTEIRDAVTLPKLNGMTMAQVSARIGLSTPIVSALAKQGFLASKTVPNPVTRIPQIVISPSAFAAFDRIYVSLLALSRRRGIAPQQLAKALRVLGVEPAFTPDLARATFYRRQDVHHLEVHHDVDA